MISSTGARRCNRSSGTKKKLELIEFARVGEWWILFFFFQAEDGIRDYKVTGVQTCALPISNQTNREPSRQTTRRPARQPAKQPARQPNEQTSNQTTKSPGKQIDR